MAMGIVVGGFGFGAFVFNQVCASWLVARMPECCSSPHYPVQIQTAIINPANVAIDAESGYFTEPALLGRVPGLMLTLAAIYLSICLFACLIITEPQTCSTPELVRTSSNLNLHIVTFVTRLFK